MEQAAQMRVVTIPRESFFKGVFLILLGSIAVAGAYLPYAKWILADVGILRMSDDQVYLTSLPEIFSFRSLWVPYLDHMMPAGKLVYWLMRSWFGLEWVYYAHALLVAQATTVFLTGYLVLRATRSMVATIFVVLLLTFNSAFIYGAVEGFVHFLIYFLVIQILLSSIILLRAYQKNGPTLSTYFTLSLISLPSMYILGSGPLIIVATQLFSFCLQFPSSSGIPILRRFLKSIDFKLLGINLVLGLSYLVTKSIFVNVEPVQFAGNAISPMGTGIRMLNFIRGGYASVAFPSQASDQNFGLDLFLAFGKEPLLVSGEALFGVFVLLALGIVWHQFRNPTMAFRLLCFATLLSIAYTYFACGSRDYLVIVKFRYVIYLLVLGALAIGSLISIALNLLEKQKWLNHFVLAIAFLLMINFALYLKYKEPSIVYYRKLLSISSNTPDPFKEHSVPKKFQRLP